LRSAASKTNSELAPELPVFRSLKSSRNTTSILHLTLQYVLAAK
jgi:hypothetical protein